MLDSTASRVFSKWTVPATVVEVLCPYSYVVDVAGTRRHFHANNEIAQIVCTSGISCV